MKFTGAFKRLTGLNAVNPLADPIVPDEILTFEYTDMDIPIPTNLSGSPRFGNDLALNNDGSLLVVGGHLMGGSNRGAIWLYTGENLDQIQFYTLPDWPTNRQFGRSVDMDANGDTIIAAATSENIAEVAQGSIYVLERSGETITQTDKLFITGSAATSDNMGAFANSIAISDDASTIVGGIPFGNGPGEISLGGDSGKVAIWNKVEGVWTNIQTISHPNQVNGAYFGYNVDVSFDGSVILISQNKDASNNTSNYGGVYVYRRSGGLYSLEQFIAPTDLGTSSQFGLGAMAINNAGTRIAIGAPVSVISGIASSITQIFDYNAGTTSWNLTTTLSQPSGSYFGSKVAFNTTGDLLMISARSDDETAVNSGAFYVYRLENGEWTFKDKMKENVPAGGRGLGANGRMSKNGKIIAGGVPSVNVLRAFKSGVV